MCELRQALADLGPAPLCAAAAEDGEDRVRRGTVGGGPLPHPLVRVEEEDRARGEPPAGEGGAGGIREEGKPEPALLAQVPHLRRIGGSDGADARASAPECKRIVAVVAQELE